MTLLTHYALDQTTQLAINQTTNRGRVHNRNFYFSSFISNHTPQTKQHVAITSHSEKTTKTKTFIKWKFIIMICWNYNSGWLHEKKFFIFVRRFHHQYSSKETKLCTISVTFSMGIRKIHPHIHISNILRLNLKIKLINNKCAALSFQSIPKWVYGKK